MYLPCFYTKYVRFFIDLVCVWVITAFFSGSQIIGIIAALGIVFLNYAFRFYSSAEISNMNFKQFLLVLLKTAFVILFIYAVLFFLSGRAIKSWMYPAAIITYLLPVIVWFLCDLFAMHVGSGSHVHLIGSYPQFDEIIKLIETSGRGRLTVHHGEKTELTPQEKHHDGHVFFVLCEVALRKIPIDLAKHFEELFTVNTQIWYVPIKRLADIIIAVSFIILFAVPMIIVAIAVYIEDHESPVFKQTRIGQKGKPFTLYKFRSMRNSEFLEHDPNANIESRVLKVGNLIRRTRLDETMQFFNVLKGDMSIIGPRPEMEFYHSQSVKEIPCYMYRLDVKPGITGWAQTCFIHTSSLDQYREKTAYDLYYVKKFNPVLDIQILVKTIGTILLLIGSR